LHRFSERHECREYQTYKLVSCPRHLMRKLSAHGRAVLYGNLGYPDQARKRHSARPAAAHAPRRWWYREGIAGWLEMMLLTRTREENRKMKKVCEELNPASKSSWRRMCGFVGGHGKVGGVLRRFAECGHTELDSVLRVHASKACGGNRASDHTSFEPGRSGFSSREAGDDQGLAFAAAAIRIQKINPAPGTRKRVPATGKRATLAARYRVPN